MNRLIICITPIALAMVVVSVHGCGIPVSWDGVARDCFDPNDPGYGKAPECIVPDAGSDGSAADGGSSEDGGSSARCTGTCVENAPNDFAAPQIVYVGKPLAKYTNSCPTEAGAFGGREYLNLHVPDPGCPKCSCGPIEGSCNPRPNTIALRADTCGVSQTATTDFSAPENWDGSCTSINAAPAGLQCPPGSGIPCVQSVYASTLLDPEQGCEPVQMPVPRTSDERPSWNTMVLSCSTTPRAESCTEAAAKTTCMPQLPTDEPGWRYCVRHDDPGVHACPSSIDSPFSEQIIAYNNGYIDERKCTECGCKSLGGSCHGILRVYKDNACSTNELLAAEGLTSENISCTNFSMAGTAVGSKEMTDIVYVEGKCEPTGGVAIGDAHPDEATAATWCCMPAPNVADAGPDAPSE